MATRRIVSDIHFLEQFYIKLHNVYSFTSQIIFFITCATVFAEIELNEEKSETYVLLALKTLLFYSVFTYFVSKTNDIWATNQGRVFPSNWNFVEGMCRIAIEWAKAVIVVFCLREQGISFKPNLAYTTITLPYYVLTERVFIDIFQVVVHCLNFDIFEDLEHLYVPLILNFVILILTFFVEICTLLATDYVKLALAGSYLLIYIRIKDTYYNYWEVIRLEKQTYESFRTATEKDLEEFDDICAVCLNKMSRAKITPCHHFFHPLCLKECLKTSFLCPICKLELTVTQ